MVTITEAFETAARYHQAGRLEEAEQIYRRILEVDGQNVDALHLLGVIAYQTGRNSLAVECLSTALRRNPGFAEAHNNLGNVLRGLGRVGEALEQFQQAVRLRPGIAEMHNNVGNTLLELGRLPEALEQLEIAVGLRPGSAEIHNSLGTTLGALGRLPEALEHFQEAVRLRPLYAEAHNNLAHTYRALGRLPEAQASYEETVRLRPGDAAALTNLGAIDRDLSRFAEALEQFDQALKIEPDSALPHWNRALVWLLQGDFERGWPEYEWRWRLKTFVDRGFTQPRWDGGPLEGRTILLTAEQGMGDTLQFIRYVPLVKQRGGHVVVECQPPLVALLTGLPGIDRLVAQKSPLPPFDVHAPLLSLPLLFGTELATVPAEVPYLRADHRLVEHWRDELARVAGAGIRVGIAWQGNPRSADDRRRSLPLEHFEPLARVPGLTLISLQKGPGREQIDRLNDRFAVTDLGAQLDETSGPFMDTAALMKSLDLVVTSDTVIAHLGGALAIPVWVALPFIPEWRWLLNRVDSPWYPTMRLFRQTETGNWHELFERIAGELMRERERERKRESGG
jgi:tetratricopeptide (TPR) repeat protein